MIAMTSNPPSYQDATRRDPLPLVAPYLSGADLARISRVSKAWHTAFAPALYGHPMRQFYHCTNEDTAAYIAGGCNRLVHALRFICTPSIQALVHTLHIPPDSEAHLLDGPLDLRGCLGHLPNLQALVASNSRLLDHSALEQLGAGEDTRLRLLIARNCCNATDFGLVMLVSRSPQLQYLDLSYTSAAGSPSVINAISRLRGLTILRLRRTNIGSKATPALMSILYNQQRNTGSRLCSLDIRDNNVDFAYLPISPIENRNVRPDQAQFWTSHDVHQYETTVQYQLININLLGEELIQPENGGLTQLYLSGNSSMMDEAVTGFFAQVQPRVLEYVVDGTSSDCSTESRKKVWSTIARNSNSLVSLTLSITDLQLISYFSLAAAEGSLGAMPSEFPPSYERATKHQPSMEPIHPFLWAFPFLERLTIAGIPRLTTDQRLLMTLERLLAAYGRAGFEREARVAIRTVRGRLHDDASRTEAHTDHDAASRALKEIVLELTNESDRDRSEEEDRDVEALRRALHQDFSFFAEENLVAPRPNDIARPTVMPPMSFPVISVVEHLKNWRHVRREAWKDRSQFRNYPLVGLAAEYWPGQVLIRRPSPGSIVHDSSDPFSWMPGAR